MSLQRQPPIDAALFENGTVSYEWHSWFLSLTDNINEASIVLVQVSDISDPRSELSSLKASQLNLIIAYQVNAGADYVTIYKTDTAVSGGENNPFVIELVDGGYAVAIAGKYVAFGLSLLGGISYKQLSADPDDPPTGFAVEWYSDGTETGNAGDKITKINVGGTIKVNIEEYSRMTA